ncbi:MAG: HupE/UreJ family protein [Gammaproteobacteria bacterium]
MTLLKSRFTVRAPTSRALLLLLALCAIPAAFAHTIAGSDANYIQAIDGPAIAPFIYLGAKHMVTGYDHLLYLFGVVFFLTRPIQVLQFVSLFALGHSITLLSGVLLNLQVNAYLIDAIIGFSIIYKAFENMGGFRTLPRFHLNPKWAVFAFGLIHGLGLATKLQAFDLKANGLFVNILSFNIGVELGQLVALTGVLLLLMLWRTRPTYWQYAFTTNTALMAGGFLLTAYQLSAFVLGAPN